MPRDNPLLPLLFCLALMALFLRWPELDLWVADWFYRPGEGFYLAQTPLVQFSYRLFAELHLWLLPLLVLWLLWALFRRGKGWRSPVFLLLLLLLAPGLLVNGVLKADSGRARPGAVVEFGGERQFTGAFRPAQECARNCSFVSGHAAMGFWFIGLASVWRRRTLLWVGIGVGGLVGLGRMAQGGHFLSDVIFAFWVVYLMAWALERLLLLGSRPV